MPQAAASGARFPPTARDRAKMSAREQLEHDEELLALRMQRRLRFNRASGPGGLQHLLRRTLKLFDKSDTGDLDYAEFRAALAYFGCDGVPDAALDALVRHFDADGSGAVNVDEFIARAEAIMFHRAPRARPAAAAASPARAAARRRSRPHRAAARQAARACAATRARAARRAPPRLRRHDADAAALDRDELLAALGVRAAMAAASDARSRRSSRGRRADGRVAVARFAGSRSRATSAARRARRAARRDGRRRRHVARRRRAPRIAGGRGRARPGHEGRDGGAAGR